MCSISYFVIKRRSANHSWRPSSNTFTYFEKITERRRFINLNRLWKKVIISCIFGELWLIFCSSAAGGARKLMKPKDIFASPGKPNFKNPCSLLYRFKHAKGVLMLKCNTVTCSIFRAISFWNFDLTCARCGNLCTVYNGNFSETSKVGCL